LFHGYLGDAKTCSCALTWWWIEKQKFPTMVALVRQNFGIPTSQIETEIIFSIARVLTTLNRRWLQIDNLEKLFFVHKNWPSNPRVGCLKPYNLVVVCEAKFDLTDKCEEYAIKDS
jgi:hypothetical protein